jgi:membrane fusion protein, heavy metal efflux system
MANRTETTPVLVNIHSVTATLLSLALWTATSRVAFAHGGHGNEFQGDQALPSASIQVDGETARRMGLTVESVVQRRLTARLKATGEIEVLPNQQVDITTPVGGTISRLLVDPGDPVTAGQVVAILSSPELAALRTEAQDRQADAIAAVQDAQADLQLAQQTYQQQERIVAQDIAQAQAALRFAQDKYDKDQALFISGAIPQRTVLESETQLAAANANLTKAESRLPVAEAQAQILRSQSALQAAHLKVRLSEKTYQTRLGQLGATPNTNGTIALKTPISGSVADRAVTPGESGQDAGKKVMTIVNGTRVQIAANIYEKDLQHVKRGQRVEVSVNGLPGRTFVGRVSVISAVVNPETRVVAIKAELDNADEVLKPGMFAELELLTSQSSQTVLTIPQSAIVETRDQKTIVFVQNGDGYEPTDVTLGKASGKLIEVKDGLFDGDRIVTQRANQLYAQSLKSPIQPKSVATTPTAPATLTQASALETLMNRVGQPLPWWGMVSMAGAIAAGTFWAGSAWATRRSQRERINPEMHSHLSSRDERMIDPSRIEQSEGISSIQHPER